MSDLNVSLGAATNFNVSLGAGGLAGSGAAVTLKNIAGSSGATTLPSLTDVITTNQGNGSIVIFNSTTSQYEVKPLNTTVLSPSLLNDALANNVVLNGGTF